MKNKSLLITLLLFMIPSLAYESYEILIDTKSSVFNEEERKVTELIQNEIKAKGYHDKFSKNAASLIKFKEKKGMINVENDPYFSILRLDATDFYLTFPFNGFSSVDEKDLLGFVPSGTVINKEWTGLTAYFNNDSLGTCRFIISDLETEKGKAFYDPRYTKFEIHGKPTVQSVSGNKESGFIYETSWTGAKYDKLLECANTKPFDRKTIKDLVILAKKLDKDLPDNP